MITGEPLVLEKAVGDKVTGGTRQSVMRAERVGSDTLLGQIVNMMAKPSGAVRLFKVLRTKSLLSEMQTD
jgi:cation transport ATPase